MRLAIADPPYPPFVGAGGRKNRASRWYGGKPRSRKAAEAERKRRDAEYEERLARRREQA